MESLPRLTIDETALRLSAGGVGWVYRCDDTISAPRSGVPGAGRTTLEGVVDAMMEDGGWVGIVKVVVGNLDNNTTCRLNWHQPARTTSDRKSANP